jgi:23S rRNA (cytidine1920-2'-O)/16S rRNA (cytidine1409-2'-O)-methyltransferase
MEKTRLDLLLVRRKLAESRAKAQALVMAGDVRVEGQVILTPSSLINPEAHLELEKSPLYVSRGGDKLAAALVAFEIPIQGRICADVGASTGGFTDCLLQHGSARVIAIDVGRGQLHWKLRSDPRVSVLEGTNARLIEHLPEPVSLVTVDASFISLRVLIPVIKKWFAPLLESEFTNSGKSMDCDVVTLIKPQFEAGRQQTAHGRGVIRDPLVHRQVLEEVLEFSQKQGFGIFGLIRSPLVGPKGNVEFLAWLKLGKAGKEEIPILTQNAMG